MYFNGIRQNQSRPQSASTTTCKNEAEWRRQQKIREVTDFMRGNNNMASYTNVAQSTGKENTFSIFWGLLDHYTSG